MTIAKAASTVADWAGQDDCYVSMNRFRGRRLMANLYSLRALWTDLDFHRLKAWQDWSAQAIWELVIPDYLSASGLPGPTVGISSGRGIYLIWLFGAVPGQALPRWSACQKRIFEAFRGLGADRQAIAADRYGKP